MGKVNGSIEWGSEWIHRVGKGNGAIEWGGGMEI